MDWVGRAPACVEVNIVDPHLLQRMPQTNPRLQKRARFAEIAEESLQLGSKVLKGRFTVSVIALRIMI